MYGICHFYQFFGCQNFALSPFAPIDLSDLLLNMPLTDWICIFGWLFAVFLIFFRRSDIALLAIECCPDRNENFPADMCPMDPLRDIFLPLFISCPKSVGRLNSFPTAPDVAAPACDDDCCIARSRGLAYGDPNAWGVRGSSSSSSNSSFSLSYSSWGGGRCRSTSLIWSVAELASAAGERETPSRSLWRATNRPCSCSNIFNRC